MRYSGNNKRNSWLAALRELFLITLGIYLAFALNNWGESRKERRLEEFYLSNLLTDVERSISQLERHLRLDSGQLEGAKVLDGLLAQGSAVDRDSLRNYLNSFNTNPRFRMNNYSYQSLLQSGDYRTIQSDLLRNQLDEFFLELLDGVITTEGYYLDRLERFYYPIKEGVYVARSDDFININRLFDPVFRDNVYIMPTYIRQEMGQLNVTLKAAYLLKSAIEEQLQQSETLRAERVEFLIFFTFLLDSYLRSYPYFDDQMENRTAYSVKQLAQLAGVSIRTLHYYDKVGFLRPARRAESRYRYYSKEELYRLQQILFYKELDYSLKDIARILDDPDFDLINSLRDHKRELMKRSGRLRQLLDTIDKTILSLKNKEGMITDEEIYAGFAKEEVPEIKKEVAERWGADKLEATENNIRKMSKTEWAEVQQEGEEISRWLANLMHLEPSAAEVQRVVKEHHRYMNQFYTIGIPAYRGLGNMYVTDERFKGYYENFREGLAGFLNKAIRIFCDNDLEVKQHTCRGGFMNLPEQSVHIHFVHLTDGNFVLLNFNAVSLNQVDAFYGDNKGLMYPDKLIRWQQRLKT